MIPREYIRLTKVSYLNMYQIWFPESKQLWSRYCGTCFLDVIKNELRLRVNSITLLPQSNIDWIRIKTWLIVFQNENKFALLDWYHSNLIKNLFISFKICLHQMHQMCNILLIRVEYRLWNIWYDWRAYDY